MPHPLENMLLPCPFCGAKAELNHVDENNEPLMSVCCTGAGCWATIVNYLDDAPATNAVAAWNRRVK